jgi:hypothetical protein
MPLMRRFKVHVALCAMHDLHAALPHQPRPRHVSTAGICVKLAGVQLDVVVVSVRPDWATVI